MFLQLSGNPLKVVTNCRTKSNIYSLSKRINGTNTKGDAQYANT